MVSVPVETVVETVFPSSTGGSDVIWTLTDDEVVVYCETVKDKT